MDSPTAEKRFPFYGHDDGLVIEGPDTGFKKTPMTPAQLAARDPALAIAKDIYRHANRAGVCYVEIWSLISQAMQGLLDRRAAAEPKAARNELAWLIEMTATPTPLYFTGAITSVFCLFENDNAKAIRFARKQDAEQCLNALMCLYARETDGSKYRAMLAKDCYAVTEHMWCTHETTEPLGTFACPICTKDSPHDHAGLVTNGPNRRWIGVDFDGTLATDIDRRNDPYALGEPIIPMVNRVKDWIAKGYEVRLFTARMHRFSYTSGWYRDIQKMESLLKDWCEKHIGVRLECTNVKDGLMEVLWDDRAVRAS